MPKTLDELARDYIGSQAMTILSLQAQIETLRARVEELEGEKMKHTGRDYSPLHRVDTPAS